MKQRTLFLTALMGIAMVWSCDITETTDDATVKSSLLAMITADDSSYTLDDWDDLEDMDFTLAKSAPVTLDSENSTLMFRDSTSIWRFARRNMAKEREVTIDVLDDSTATGLITYHVTGTFHIKQFEKVWTTDSTWERGDSIRFSEKPIDLTINRQVNFGLFEGRDGEEHWKPVSMTMAYGSTGSALDIGSLEWIAGDSIRILDDLQNEFYGWNNPLVFQLAYHNRVNVILSNDTADEAEWVRGNWAYHPRMNGPEYRTRRNFHYVETLDNGDKVYSQSVDSPDRPRRMFRGSIKVVDHRTLFDHDYPSYSVVTLGFTYFLSRGVWDL